MKFTLRNLMIAVAILAAWFAFSRGWTGRSKADEAIQVVVEFVGIGAAVGALFGRAIKGAAAGLLSMIVWAAVMVLMYGFPC